MFFTVTTQTYNRADVLARMLESLRSLRGPAGVEYEILVVDNNSTDRTPAVIQQYETLLAPRLRRAFEPRQGLSHARNRALQEAKGEVVSFLDDDVIVEPGWLTAVAGAFREHAAAVVGGKSYLIYPGPKPAWLMAEHEELLSRLDHGNEVLVGTQKDLFGLNFSVRKDLALRVGGFNPSLGRSGRCLSSGEERDLQDKIAALGGVVVYEPRAVVGHMVSPERLTKRWFLRRVYHGAISGQRARQVCQKQNSSMPELLWDCIRACGVCLAASLFLVDRKRQSLFVRQLDVVFAVGRLKEAMSHRHYA